MPPETTSLDTPVTAGAPPSAPHRRRPQRPGRATPIAAPGALVDAVHRIESADALDSVAAVVERAAGPLAQPGTAHDVLTGAWLGHALHPALTDLPLGAWTSASLLDLIGGRSSRPAARRLIGFGVLTALPTAATGLAEWLEADTRSRRVGLVHAHLNAVGLAFYAASLAARRRGRHGRGVVLGLTGWLVAGAAAYLGGHLTLVRKVGTRDVRFSRPDAGGAG